MKKTLNKKSARRKRKVMSPEERLRKKEQRDQMKEIRDIMSASVLLVYQELMGKNLYMMGELVN